MAVKRKVMAMTDEEIIAKYERSDKKAGDIQIIAELNGCSKEAIENIIEEHLGPDALPKRRKRNAKKNDEVAPVQPETVPAKAQEKSKVKVGRFIMEAVQDRMDEVNGQLMELTREIFSMEQRKEEMEKAYQEYVDFMETHCIEE